MVACIIHERLNVVDQIIYRSCFKVKAIERCDIMRNTREQNPCTRSNLHSSAAGQIWHEFKSVADKITY